MLARASGGQTLAMFQGRDWESAIQIGAEPPDVRRFLNPFQIESRLFAAPTLEEAHPRTCPHSIWDSHLFRWRPDIFAGDTMP